ncbi:MAG TPA: thiamine pyrophosphate-binding protein [Candidatus Limnocylindrales bacterium]|nr:thiamine pyrophosphate-binding protein [Candidatus Limnocylindrales bacterium]
MSGLRTGGQVIADHLAANGVPYVVGIPGHGSLPMVDAFVGRDSPVFLQVRHEQAAAHLADAYFRVARKPLAVMTSIGPGAVNAAVGIATAYVDSSSMLVFTCDVHTYMFGRGVLQEIDRKAWADLTTVFEPITKRLWQVTRVDQLARILPQAFALAAGGRPGPVLISVPMDVQADAADVPAARPVDLPEPPAPAAGAVSQIRAALADAERPVLLAGGGVVQSGASARFRQIAEHLGMPVVATYQAKGVLPEDHPLYGRYPGSKGTDTGNALCREADIILAIGCRFADEATSSYVPGVTFSIPPTRLYQVDIDEYEIGKNYPVELGVVADAAAFCEALWEGIRDEPRDEARRATWERRIADLVVPWNARLAPGRSDRSLPLRISAVLDIVHGTVPTDTIVLTGAGHSQAQFLQEYTVNDASQVISPNGFSTMGFTVPGAIGARLAAPDRPVLGFAGDGDFLMTVQELAMAAQYGLDVIYVVVDNAGWQSIRDLQLDVYGEERGFAAEFRTPKGASITPDLVTVARGFGVESIEATDEPALKAAIGRALASGGPTVIVVPVRREHPESAGPVSGWWDVPVPASLPERRGIYEREVAPVRRDAVKRS